MTVRRRLALGTVLLAGAAAFLISGRGPQESPEEGVEARAPAADDAPALSLTGRPPADRPTAPPSPAPTQPTAATLPLDVPRPGPWLPAPAKPPKMLLRGRLLEADGSPAAGAMVGARGISGSDAQVIPLVGEGVSAADGRFEVSLFQDTDIELWVWSRRSPPIVLPRVVGLAESVELGDVSLPAGLAIEGRVLVGGRPCPFGPAVLHVMRDQVQGVIGMFERGLAFDRDGRPISGSATASPDAEGHWKVDGLSPGRYRVSIWDVGGAYFHEAVSHLLTREVNTPARAVDFDLPVSLLAVARTTVRVRGSAGRTIQVTTSDGSRTRILRPEERALTPLMDPPPSGARPGDALLLVPAETPLSVWVQDEGHAGWRSEVISAPAGEVLRLTPTPRETGTGWIKLRRDTPVQRSTSQVRMRLTVPHTGEVVREATTWLPAPDFAGQLEVPLGTWNIELWPTDAPQGSDEELLLPQQTRIEVGASLEVAPVVTWAPARGGRVLIHVAAEETSQRAVRCTLLREGQPPMVPWFRSVLDLPGVDRSSVHTFTLPLAANVRMETDGALAPGGVVLRLECEGFETQEVPVVIRPGETTEVNVRLVRR